MQTIVERAECVPAEPIEIVPRHPCCLDARHESRAEGDRAQGTETVPLEILVHVGIGCVIPPGSPSGPSGGIPPHRHLPSRVLQIESHTRTVHHLVCGNDEQRVSDIAAAELGVVLVVTESQRQP